MSSELGHPVCLVNWELKGPLIEVYLRKQRHSRKASLCIIAVARS